MPFDFKSDERAWLNLKWDALRKANIAADAASGKWSKINEEINDYLRRSPSVDHEDPAQVARLKAPILALKDARATYDFHQLDAMRIASDIQVFLKMKELGFK